MIGILRSLGITVVVSCGIAFFLTEFDVSFWKTFTFITVVQFLGWAIYNKKAEAGYIKDSQEATERMVQEVVKQQAVVDCAYCKKQNIIDIRLDIDNDFNCTECDKLNAVFVEIETATKSQMIQNEGKTLG